MKKYAFVFMLGIFLPGFFCLGCFSAPFRASAAEAELRVASWNLQTFFDGVTDGSEYSEFKGASSRWSQKKYMQRLERLTRALRTLDADVVVLEELEKKEQLYDIFNQLSGTFRLKKLYRYGCFVAEPGAGIGVGVLSRYPLTEARVHALDIGTGRGVQPSLRPLLEVTVVVNGRGVQQSEGGRRLCLFACHWKSKLGSDSAVWRKWQELVLYERMASVAAAGGAAIACGDFNQTAADFTCLSLLCAPEPASVCGSYWYRGEWELIDHLFAAGGALVSDFCVESGEWADAQGRPVRYDMRTGEGWSDHLPVSCTVRF